MRLKITVTDSVEAEQHPASSDPIPITWPCLLVEVELRALLLGLRGGFGIVLSPGRSRELKVGDLVPYAASRWAETGVEQHDFIPAPSGLTVAFNNAD